MRSNSLGIQTSNPTRLHVQTGPPEVIGISANSTTPRLNSYVILSSTVEGGYLSRYQWFFNGSELNGENEPVLFRWYFSEGDQGRYQIAVDDVLGAVMSDPIELLVGSAPVILLSPVSQVVTQGGALTLVAEVSQALPRPELSWWRDGMLVSRVDIPSLSLQNVSTNDAGLYTLVASNEHSRVESAAAVVSVLPIFAPSIVLSLTNVSVPVGSPVTLTAIVNAFPPAWYQWQKDGQWLDDATNTTLSWPAIAITNSGAYTLVASNSLGVTTGAIAQVSAYYVPPSILSHPGNVTGRENTLSKLAASARGVPSPDYQWMKDGVAVPGANTNTLFLGPLRMGDAGTYFLIASNLAGQATSRVAQVVVQPGVGGVGSLDPSFLVAAGEGEVFRAARVLRSGSILVGGNFTRIGGVPIRYLARLFPNGSVDTSFRNGPDDLGPVNVIQVLEDGKFYTGGPSRLRRHHENGEIDWKFSHGLRFTALNDLRIDSQGRLLLAGQIQSDFIYSGLSLPFVRLSPDGVTDHAFYNSLASFVGTPSWGVKPSGYSFFEQPDGSLLIAGDLPFGPNPLPTVFALNPDGSSRAQLLYRGKVCQQLEPASGGGMVAVGPSDAVPGAIRFYPTNTPAPFFDANLSSSSRNFRRTDRVLVQDDQKILVGGNFAHPSEPCAVAATGLVRLGTDGELDPTWPWLPWDATGCGELAGSYPRGTLGDFRPLDLFHDGGVLGSLTRSGFSRPQGFLLRASGGPWSFPSNTAPTVSTNLSNTSPLALHAFPEGGPKLSLRWLHNGQEIPGETRSTFYRHSLGLRDSGLYDVVVSNYLGIHTSHVAQVAVHATPATPAQFDPSFYPWVRFDGAVRSVGLGKDDSIRVAGEFGFVEGRRAEVSVRLDRNGRFFDADPVPDRPVGHPFDGRLLAPLGDGSMFIAASRSILYGGKLDLPLLYQIAADGQLLRSFDSDDILFNTSTLHISALLPWEGDRLLVGSMNYKSSRRLILLNADGSEDRSWLESSDLVPQGFFHSLLLSSRNVLWIGGPSYFPGEQALLVRGLDPSGAPSRASLQPDRLVSSHVEDAVNQMLELPDGRILVAGAFRSVSTNFAVLAADGSLDDAAGRGVVVDGAIKAMAMIPDGRILLGGNFTKINGQRRTCLAALMPDLTLDKSEDFAFEIAGAAVPTVSALRVDRFGRILVGGTFSLFRGRPCWGLVRLQGNPRLPPPVYQDLAWRFEAATMEGYSYALEFRDIPEVGWRPAGPEQSGTGDIVRFQVPGFADKAQFFRLRFQPSPQN